MRSLMLRGGIVLGLASLVAAGSAAAQTSLTGAGATFPNPIYTKWFDAYNKKTGVQVNYQSIGSGGGIRQFTEGTVDFGATDGPMNDDQIAAVKGNVLHVPTVMGAVVLTYALSNDLAYATVKNPAGEFVDASLASVTAAAASAKFDKDTDFRVSITNAPGKDSYPISSFTWLLVHPDQPDAAKAKAIRDFLKWMISPDAQQMATELKYAPLPKEVVTLIDARLPSLKSNGKAIASE